MFVINTSVQAVALKKRSIFLGVVTVTTHDLANSELGTLPDSYAYHPALVPASTSRPQPR